MEYLHRNELTKQSATLYDEAVMMSWLTISSNMWKTEKIDTFMSYVMNQLQGK